MANPTPTLVFTPLPYGEQAAVAPTVPVVVPAPGNIGEDTPVSLNANMVPLYFGVTDLANALSDSQLYLSIPGSAAAQSQMSMLMPFSGSVVGLALTATGAKTAGVATFRVYKNGVLFSAGSNLAEFSLPDAQTGYKLWQAGLYSFAAGDELDVRVTTTGLSPAGTMDVSATLMVSQQLA